MSILKIKCRNVLSCITKKKKCYGELLVFSGVVDSVLRCPSLPLCACFVSFLFWQQGEMEHSLRCKEQCNIIP